MVINKEKIRQLGKRIVKISLLLLVLILVLLSAAWYVLKSDHEYIIEKIKTTALEKYNVDLDLKGYELELSTPFPSINFQVNDLSISNIDFPQHPLIKINTVTSQFRPWDFGKKNFKAQPFSADSIWVLLYKDSLDNSNLNINGEKKGFNKKEKIHAINFDFQELPFIKINYLDFHRQDDFRNKWQSGKLTDVAIQTQKSKKGIWFANLSSDVFFEGLVFNENDRGFLRKKDGQFDLNFSISDKKDALVLENATLEVNETTFLLDGKLTIADTNRVQLQIANQGVTMKKIIPMLSSKIEKILEDIEINQPIAAKFSFDKFLKSGKKEVIKVDFQTESADLIYRNVKMSSAKLQGYFSNDCDNDGIGNNATSCVLVNQLSGDILEVLPMDMKGRIYQLNNPRVDVVGKMNINLPRLNALLAPKDKFTFTQGVAKVDFDYQGELLNLLNSPFDEQDIVLNGDAYFEEMTVKTDNRYARSPSLSGHLSFDENQALLDDINLEWMNSNVHISGNVGNLPEFLFYEDEALKSNISLHFDQVTVDDFLKSTPSQKQANQSKSMNAQELEKITRRIAGNINGKIKLNIDRLNYDTFFVENINTQFKLFSPRRAEYVDSFMVQMRQLSANFMGISPFSIDLGLSQDSITDVNLELKIPAITRFVNFFSYQKTKINQGDASFYLAANLPFPSFFNSKNILSELKYTGNIHFDKIEMEVDAFELPFKKITGLLNFDSDDLIFDSLKFQYESSPFLLDGKISDYALFRKNKKNKTSVDLLLKGQFLDLRKEKRKELIDKKSTRKIKSNNTSLEKNNTITTAPNSFSPSKSFRSLDTIFQLVSGKINMSLDSILTDKHTVNPFLLQAKLIPDNDFQGQHQLVVDSFNLGFGKENTVKGNAHFRNPEAPTVEAHFKTRMKFSQLGKFLTSEFIEMQDGYFKMDLDYQSRLHDTLNAENYLLHAAVNGEAEIVNGKIFYNYRDFTFDNIYSHFKFDERAIYIRDIDLEVNGNRFLGSGQSKGLFPYFILPNRRANIELEITSPRFDFGKFTAPHGLGKDTILTKVNEVVIRRMKNDNLLPLDTTVTMMEKTGSLIDQLLDQGSMEMTTTCDELVYNDFIARNLKGKISLQPDSVQLKKVKMDVADGTFQIDGLLSDVARHEPKMQVQVQLVKNDIREIFRQFENFGQTQLGYKNLQGKASANIDFKADINSNYSILPETMFGQIGFKLSGAQLLDVEALKKVSGFISRKRQMDNILIDTLETFMHIRGNDMYVDNFLLHSSSFDFGVEGVYSFGSINNTRILFTVPISNLFRKHVTGLQLKSGNAKRKGMNILIEARPKKNRMRFRWKIFKGRKSKYRLPEEKKKIKK